MSINFRKATRADISNIVRLLADDPLELCVKNMPLPLQYYTAFDEINSEKNNYLIVVELDNQVIGTLQLTLITYLTY